MSQAEYPQPRVQQWEAVTAVQAIPSHPPNKGPQYAGRQETEEAGNRIMRAKGIPRIPSRKVKMTAEQGPQEK